MTTLTRLIRTFEQKPIGTIGSEPQYQLVKRKSIFPALENSIVPCLNCGEMKVNKAHGQIVRFCNKNCRKQFKRAEYKESKRK